MRKFLNFVHQKVNEPHNPHLLNDQGVKDFEIFKKTLSKLLDSETNRFALEKELEKWIKEYQIESDYERWQKIV